MIRATKGTSMDGWMDGEVLIIGRVVGWSGGVPNSLPSDNLRRVALSSMGRFSELILDKQFLLKIFVLGLVLEGLGGSKWRPKLVF